MVVCIHRRLLHGPGDSKIASQMCSDLRVAVCVLAILSCLLA